MFECYECGEEFHRIGSCPVCGSENIGKILDCDEDDEDDWDDDEDDEDLDY